MTAVILDLKSSEDPRDVVHQAVEALAAGKIIAIPTETVYGLAASALHPEAVQRLVEYRGFSEEDAQSRIAAQVPPDKRLELADFVIDNSVTFEELAPQIESAFAWAQTLPATEPTPEPDDVG